MALDRDDWRGARAHLLGNPERDHIRSLRGPVTLRRTQAALLALPLLAAALVVAVPTAAAATCGVGATSLGNGGFEDPGAAPGSYVLLDASAVAPWNTTDDVNQIELWGDTFGGINAFEGGSFAELNANSPGTLYQDVVTTPGTTMDWTLHHRGRDGTDVMKVLIGDAGTADVHGDTGWDAVSPDITDGPDAWGTATGSYVVPAGQTCTRFGFRAVSSGVGIGSYGNFLDDISFSISTATPNTAPSHAPSHAPTAKAAVATAHPQVTPPPTDADVLSARAGDHGTEPGQLAFLMITIGAALAAATRVRARRRIAVRQER